MTRARYQQVSLADTPYYHCISRCVRRAYLCGDDPVSGRNFDHRKRWLVDLVKQLSARFAVDVCAYAIMSNHYHLVLHVDEAEANSWTDEEVIERWSSLFPRNAALVETLQKNSGSRAAVLRLKQQIDLWRSRLTDLSWFMRCLNESVARRANREDECTGRFWEGRFKSQALLDEKALVTCMAYVDLNPVRAGLTDNLDTSDFTSIQERLITHARRVKHRSYRQQRLLTRRSAKHLLVGRRTTRQAGLKPLSRLQGGAGDSLPISEASYIDLLENTCKALHLVNEQPLRAAHLLENRQDLLGEMGIDPRSWLESVVAFHRHYATAAGTEESLTHYHGNRIRAGVEYKHRLKWIRGLPSARLLYGT